MATPARVVTAADDGIGGVSHVAPLSFAKCVGCCNVAAAQRGDIGTWWYWGSMFAKVCQRGGSGAVQVLVTSRHWRVKTVGKENVEIQYSGITYLLIPFTFFFLLFFSL